MKYFIVHTPSKYGEFEGKTPVAASTPEKAVQKFCRYVGIMERPPARYYAVEISKADFDLLPAYSKLL